MKLTALHKTNKDDQDSDCMSDSDDEQEENAQLEYKKIEHPSGINRIRAMPHPEHHIVATFAETGKVNIFDFTAHVNSFDSKAIVSEQCKPIYVNTAHGRNEGYGLDWSSTVAGRLLSGDVGSKIFLTQSIGSGFATDAEAFKGHTDSIEDIQWSPSEQNIFCTASADKTIKVWDCRAGKKPQLSIVAHTADVNVLSWNRYAH